MQQQIRYKSPAKAHVAGSTLHFRNFLPRSGPSGRRLVVDRFDLVCTTSDLDVSVAAIEGEERYRFYKRIIVEQADGRQRWNLTGEETRVALYMLMGADKVPEFADIAVANDQAVSTVVPIPMTKRFARRPKDYALPADALGKISVECADLTAAGLAIGGATIAGAAGNLTYYVLAHCHEENGVEIKAEDEVKSTPVPTAAGFTLVTGGRLQDLTFFRTGAAGGLTVAALTGIRIDGVMPEELLRTPDLVEGYKIDRATATNLQSTDGSPLRNDPHTLATPLACPALWSTEDSRPIDGAEADELIVRLTNTYTDLTAIHRVVVPKSGDLAARTLSRFKVDERNVRMKTKNKSRKNPEQWEESEAAYMPQVG